MTLPVPLQAPVVAAATPADAKAFAITLKHIVANMWRHGGRLAFTGSGIMTLLSTLRAVPPNDFMLWDSVIRVHLGATPSYDNAIVMARHIFAARMHHLPDKLIDIVTPTAAVDLLSSQTATAALLITAPRPALLAYLFDLACMDHGDSGGVLNRAIEKLVEKLMVESRGDAAAALTSMSSELRVCLHSLAHSGSGAILSDLVAPLPGASSFRELLLALCEPVPAAALAGAGTGTPTLPERRMRLMPPYGALLNSMLGENGAVLVTMTRGSCQWALGDELLRMLVFFFEQERFILGTRGLSSSISTAVLGVLSDNGILVCEKGVLAPVSLEEVQRFPVIRAVLKLLGAGKSLSDLSAATTAMDATYFQSFGFRLLIWLRHLHAHSFVLRSPLTDVGLTACIVQQAANAAFRVGETLGVFALVGGAPSIVATATLSLRDTIALNLRGRDLDKVLAEVHSSGWS